MIQRAMVIILCVAVFIVSCSNKRENSEIIVKQAINIAVNHAKTKNYNTETADVEVLKVKKGIERGPIRILSIIRFFPQETVLKNEYWIVYFYPKGELENPRHLGGDFIVLVDLHSGNILGSFEGM